MRRQKVDATSQAPSAGMSGDISQCGPGQPYGGATAYGGVQLYNPAEFVPVAEKQPAAQIPQYEQQYFHQQSTDQFYYQDGARADNPMNGQTTFHENWQRQQAPFDSDPNASFQAPIHRSFSDVWNNWEPKDQTIPRTDLGPYGSAEGPRDDFQAQTWQFNSPFGQTDPRVDPQTYAPTGNYDPTHGFKPISMDDRTVTDGDGAPNWSRDRNVTAGMSSGSFDSYNEGSDAVADEESATYDDTPQGWEGDKPRPPLLRADSWISNSSLLTYNRSMTGSQELLNSLGSLPYGEEHAGNFYHLGGERHTSLPQVERLSLVDHTRRAVVSPLAACEAPRSPTLGVSSQNVAGERKELTPQLRDEDVEPDHKKLEDDSPRNETLDAKVPSLETDSGNVEVVDCVGSPQPAPELDIRQKTTLSAVGHRDESPFKVVTRVVQHQSPVLKIDPSINIGANLESTPDNVERPLDVDVIATAQQNALLNPRQRTRDAQENSRPTATLWENPEPSKDFKVVLAPAGSIVPHQQSALVVPSFVGQGPMAEMERPAPPSVKPAVQKWQFEVGKDPGNIQISSGIAQRQVEPARTVTQQKAVESPVQKDLMETPQMRDYRNQDQRAPSVLPYEDNRRSRDNLIVNQDHREERRPSYSQDPYAGDYDDRGYRRDDHRGDRRSHNDRDPYYSRYEQDRPRDRPRTPASVGGTVQDRYGGSQERYPPRYPRGSRDNVDPNRRTPERPQSRDGSESDHGSGRYSGAPYDPYRAGGHYARDPRYQAYNNYWYANQQYYSNPYYANPYNYGYYTELYGNDPRYQNYYGAVPRAYGNYYGYTEMERRSLSGRSSVTDEMQQERGRFAEDFHRPSSQPAASFDQSTIYPYNEQTQFLVAAEPVDEPYTPPADSDSSATYTETPVHRLTPAKFSYPHCKATLTGNGQMVVVLPNSVLDGQPAIVEIQDLQATRSADVQVFRDFPGPLVRGQTHKNDVINFCVRKAQEAAEDFTLVDRESQVLVWQFLVLLVRQNGVVVGTDIAELLVKSNVGFPHDDGSNPTGEVTGNVTLNEERATEAFRELLLFGRKKDALEWAISHGLWGHALVLSSKMDNKTYASVMTRFTNSFAKNDPLQTLYQLMSGRQPASVTCVADERWGNWRSHLAMILSNTSSHPDVDRRSVVTLGDTLAARGCVHAAHFCYIVAQVDIGHFSKKSSKFVLVGASHGLPFEKFASNEAIQCTELFEYAQSLSNKDFILPAFQPYKFLYATRLADAGLCQDALQYCEVIESVVGKAQFSSNVPLAIQVYELGDKLKFNDPQLAMSSGAELEDQGDPAWLKRLQDFVRTATEPGCRVEEPVREFTPNADFNYQEGSYVTPPQPSDGDPSLQQYPANAVPLQTTAWTGREHANHGDADPQYNTQYLDSQYNKSQYDEPATHLHNSNAAVPQTSNFYQPLTDNYQTATSEQFDYYAVGANGAAEQNPVPSQPVPRSPAKTKSLGPSKVVEAKKNPENKTLAHRKQGGGWLGGIFSKLSLRAKNQMILPDDKNPTIVWDAGTESWVNTEAGEDETEAAPAAPPTDFQLKPGSPAATAPNGETGNSSVTGYKLHAGTRRGMRQNYVDVLAGNTTSSRSMPPNLFQNVANLPTASAPRFFIPAPVNVSGDDDSGHVDFVTRATAQPRVGNPRSRPSSPSDDTEEAEEKPEPETAKAPLMFDPETTVRTNVSVGPKGGLGRYGRYPK